MKFTKIEDSRPDDDEQDLRFLPVHSSLNRDYSIIRELAGIRDRSNFREVRVLCQHVMDALMVFADCIDGRDKQIKELQDYHE